MQLAKGNLQHTRNQVISKVTIAALVRPQSPTPARHSERLNIRRHRGTALSGVDNPPLSNPSKYATLGIATRQYLYIGTD